MTRTPRRYKISLHLSGGQTEVVHFSTLETFQEWYQALAGGGSSQAFVNIPLGDFEGEYLVIRPEAIIGVRVEPQFASIDDA